MTSLLKCLFLVIFYMASRLTYYVYLSSIYSHYINLTRLNQFYISQKRPNNILGLYNVASNYVSLILAAPELWYNPPKGIPPVAAYTSSGKLYSE